MPAMRWRLGDYELSGRAVLAPMAGVTDRPFRVLCRRFGAALTPAEMLSADQRLWSSAKSRRRMDHEGEPEPRVVQLVGSDPVELAQAARVNVELGAQVIDLNMGCPAKKVCNRDAGSALLADEPLIRRILDAVVDAVAVPVTLKIRTGIDPTQRNAMRVAQIAHSCGIAALAIHGRTRLDFFRGAAEYDTIRLARTAFERPLFANGDIDAPARARAVLDFTGAQGVMIGRAAQGAPWIFRDVNAYLASGRLPAPLLRAFKTEVILQHLESLYAFYGEYTGVRVARKHLSWYCRQHAEIDSLRHMMMAAEDSASQFAVARQGFDRWIRLEAA
ncbi:MAG TPA: tRNA dihydrouridine synthase DusB [Steroidobacteraceae bacterium]|nr:tRNA dihydrouridine synthase DusB [Steroidobacteraceae bacterium]